MIIADSTIHLSSDHSSVEQYSKSERLEYWNSGEEPKIQNSSGKNLRAQAEILVHQSTERVSLSAESVRQSSDVSLQEKEESEVMTDLNIRILRAMIERITGKRVKFFSLKEPGEAPSDKTDQPQTSNKTPEQSPGFGLIYDYHESYYEAESTSLSASGQIRTGDGAEVDFSVDVNMSREFYQENNINIRMGEALKDPLVINFSGTSAELTQTKFAFDIDADGTDDTLSFVSPESGFLALDKNGDGTVNNGKELFGAMTGNGFSDLAAYDNDENGWIDENDSVYDKLQIWVKDAEGNDTLFALGQKGIGAIYLGNIDTPFSLKDEANIMDGQIVSSGIYIREDYGVGTVQQLDLVV